MKLVLDQCKQGFVSHKAALSSTQHPTKADQVEDGHTEHLGSWTAVSCPNPKPPDQESKPDHSHAHLSKYKGYDHYK